MYQVAKSETAMDIDLMNAFTIITTILSLAITAYTHYKNFMALLKGPQSKFDRSLIRIAAKANLLALKSQTIFDAFSWGDHA